MSTPGLAFARIDGQIYANWQSSDGWPDGMREVLVEDPKTFDIVSEKKLERLSNNSCHVYEWRAGVWYYLMENGEVPVKDYLRWESTFRAEEQLQQARDQLKQAETRIRNAKKKLTDAEEAFKNADFDRNTLVSKYPFLHGDEP